MKNLFGLLVIGLMSLSISTFAGSEMDTECPAMNENFDGKSISHFEEVDEVEDDSATASES